MKIIERDRKILISGGILIGIIASYILIFEPLMKYETKMRKDIAIKTGVLNGYEAILKDRAEIELKHRKAKTLLERAKNRIFSAKTKALAAAQLQSFIQNSAGRYNVTIKSMNIKKVEKPVSSDLKTEIEGYDIISIQLTTYSNIRGIIDFLYELETAPRFINITSAIIRGEIVKEASRLDANIVVEGLAEIES